MTGKSSGQIIPSNVCHPVLHSPAECAMLRKASNAAKANQDDESPSSGKGASRHMPSVHTEKN
ncbi:hypothetical protein IG631_06488 [Alternaria alternata]|nr:hypothetical protein IG631_06488 [Alternaria alternata]